MASWIASLAAVPVRATPSPESGLASLMSAALSGRISSASPARQGLLLLGGKTWVGQLEQRWSWSRTTLRASVSELRHALSALRMWVLPTNAKDFSSWPTPTATDAKASGSAGYSTASGRHSGTTLTDAAVRSWPTPRASDGDKGGPGQSQHGKPSLVAMARSPVMWATPAARDDRDNRGSELPHGRHSDSLPVQARRGNPSMVLNPAFVESLMGLPRGWTSPIPMTASDCVGTASSGSRRRRRSSSAGNDSSPEVCDV